MFSSEEDSLDTLFVALTAEYRQKKRREKSSSSSSSNCSSMTTTSSKEFDCKSATEVYQPEQLPSKQQQPVQENQHFANTSEDKLASAPKSKPLLDLDYTDSADDEDETPPVKKTKDFANTPSTSEDKLAAKIESRKRRAFPDSCSDEDDYIPPLKKELHTPSTSEDKLPPQTRGSRKALPLLDDSDSAEDDYIPPMKKNGAPSRSIDEKLFPSVSTLLADVEDYCCRATNITRDGIPMAADTFRKTRLHLLLFLTFLIRERREEPTLEKLEQRDFVEGFLDWIQSYRELQYSTLATYLHNLLTGLRFVCSKRGDTVEAHSMYIWLTRKRETCKKIANRTTGNNSWQALQNKKEWISW